MQTITICYDEEKAIQEKKRIDAETPEKNRKAKQCNRTLAILTIALAVAYIFCIFAGFWYLSTLDLFVAWRILISLAALMITIFIGVGLFFFYSDNLDVIMPAEDYYTPAIQFHVATENKKLLHIEPLGNPPWKITLVLEDEDHVITKKDIIFHFAHKLRTDISETIIDLDQKIVYTPYNKEDA